MTAYACMDTASVSFTDGCGREHKRPSDGERLVVDCPTCEPLIWEFHSKEWGHSPEEAPLGGAEEAELERQKKEGDAVMRGAGEALAEIVKAGLLQQHAPEPKKRASRKPSGV